MPGKIKVRVLGARNLPVMDRSSENTDAFAEVKFSDYPPLKTEVCRKSLNPIWNSEVFKFEVADDLELQDEPLQIRIMDYDTYSANDAIGKVYIDLNPLLIMNANNPLGNLGPADENYLQPRLAFSSPKPNSNMLSGWLPIYDTLHGIRGEVNVVVKVELFSDFNKFRESSCGVRFFCGYDIPVGYRAKTINGFVEDLMVNDDPEYQWIDKIRTPRASNEARQSLFMKLSGAVRRKIGLKALELGANAVVGYEQKFDVEGDTGIVVRGIGTAVTLIKADLVVPGFNLTHKDLTNKESYGDSSCGGSIGAQEHHLQNLEVQQHHQPRPEGEPKSESNKVSPVPPSLQPISIKSATEQNAKEDDEEFLEMRKDLDEQVESDEETGSPKVFSFGGSSWTNDRHFPVSSKLSSRMVPPEGIDLLEYPFLTLKKFPQGFLQRVGGLVSCRSVKLLDGLEEEDEETRDSWWIEVRKEIRSHARCLGCNVVVGYTEDTAIWDEVAVLCATGTAAVADLHFMLDLDPHGGSGMFGPSFFPQYHDRSMTSNPQDHGSGPELLQQQTDEQQEKANKRQIDCSFVHIPYVDYSLPYVCRTAKCAVCGKGRVPDVMFTTIEPQPNYEITGRGCLLQAKVLRLKKDLKGETNAKDISDALPFMEYETHRQLLNKLKVLGMNALFGLKTKISVSDRALIATVTATACFLTALPVPSQPKLMTNSAWQNDPQYLSRTQKKLEEKILENEKYYGLQQIRKERKKDSETDDASGAEVDGGTQHQPLGPAVEDACETEGFSAGAKDMCVLEIDDSEDVDILDSMMDPFPPPLIQVLSTEEIIGFQHGLAANCCQTFAKVWRGKIHPSSRDLSSACQRVLSGIYFKLRRFRPCILTRVNFQADLDDENELQICVYGTVIALSSGGTRPMTTSTPASNNKSEESACNVSEKGSTEHNVGGTSSSSSSNLHSKGGSKGSSPSSPNPRPSLRFYSDGKSLSSGINLTPLSYIPGAKIEHYLGNLNFFLIRETSSLREVGGLNTFIQLFLSEVFSIVRSHVTVLGGNALVSYFMSEFMVVHSQSKNQSQVTVHVGGDVVSVTFVRAPAEKA